MMENMRVTPERMDKAFRNGVKSHSTDYLDILKRMSSEDYELDNDKDDIAKSFEKVKNDVRRGFDISTLSLNNLKTYGLPSDVVMRLGYLAVKHEVAPSTITTVPRSTNHTYHQHHQQKLSRIASVDDMYDDDTFEEIEEEEELRGRYVRPMDGSDEYLAKSKNKNKTKKSIHEILIDDDSEIEDVEDLTYDNNNYYNTPQNVSDYRRYPKISPETPKYAQDKTSYGSSYSDDYSGDSKSSPTVPPSFISIPSSSSTSSSSSTIAATVAAPTSSIVSSSITASTEVRASTAVTKKRNPDWINRRKWKLGAMIGKGSFGDVFQGFNDKGTLFAVKCMNMLNQPSEVDNLLFEIKLMLRLSHPHIVEYYGASVDELGVLHIFQEWVPGGSVQDLLTRFGSFALSTVREYTKQILEGLDYLHSNNIIHRDIKGGNILVNANRTVKLADFGASTTLTQFNQTQETTTIKGTPYFMAPEVLSNSKYGRKGDVWAVGCTMIQMLTGEPPWKDQNIKGLVQLHILLSTWDRGPPPFKCQVTPECRHCLEMCFNKNETDRPTVAELLKCGFLDYDELDESNSSILGRSRISDSQDDLEDSGVIRGLKLDIEKAAKYRNSVSAIHPGGGGVDDEGNDTISFIDHQIHQKNHRRKTADDVTISNHNQHLQRDHGKQNNDMSPYRQVQWDSELPPSNFDQGGGGGGGGGFRSKSDATPGSSPSITPKSTSSTPLKSSSAASSSSSSSNSSSPPAKTKINNHVVVAASTSSSNNPFAKGQIQVRRNSKTDDIDGGNGPGMHKMIVESINNYDDGFITNPFAKGQTQVPLRRTSKTDEIEIGVVASHKMIAEVLSPSSSSITHSTTTSSTTAAVIDDQQLVRDSLANLKLKTRAGSAQNSSRVVKQQSMDTKPPNINTRYDNSNISSNRDSEELTPLAGIDDSDNDDYAKRKERYQQSNYRGKIMPPVFDRHESSGSIEEDLSVEQGSYHNATGEEVMYKDIASNAKYSSHDHNNNYNNNNNNNSRPMSYQSKSSSSISTSKSVSSSTYIIGSHGNTTTSASYYRDNSTMRKSSSTTDTGRGSGGGGADGYPSSKKSESARVRRPTIQATVEAHQNRPRTVDHTPSTAAYVSTGPTAMININTSGYHSSSHMMENTVIKLSSPTREAMMNDFNTTSVDDDDDNDDNDDYNDSNAAHIWMCRKCGRENKNPQYCDNCASVKGSTGKKGADAPIIKTSR